MYTTRSLLNESDVEQKFVYPLLTGNEGLGYSDDEVATKHRVRKLYVEKGASGKSGYFPDYIVSIDAIPLIVIEAKAPGVHLDIGFREARLYASELNAHFPTGINPVGLVAATNGEELWLGVPDSAEPEKRISLSDLSVQSRGLEEIRALCSRDSLTERAARLKKQIWRSKRYRPLNFMSTSSQQEEVEPNKFAKQLIPYIRKYFDPDASRTRLEIVERAYVSTEQVTQYNQILEALLGDNLAGRKFKAFSEVVTTKNDAKEFNSALKEAIAKGARTESLLLLIGSVGAGKSIFIDRYFYLLMDEEIRSATLWAYVDFNNAPSDLDGLQNWICEQVVADLEFRNAIEKFYSYENLLRYFSPEISRFRSGVAAGLVRTDPAEYERRLSSKLDEWTTNPKTLAKNVLRHYVGDVGKRVIVVFDNADKRARDQQLRIFQEVQNFRSNHKVFSILSLRDETYDRHRNEPPLDTYLAAFTFRISPPRFLDVVKRRLELIIEDLAAQVEKNLEFRLPSGAVVRYPSSDLGAFLISFYQSLFHPKREIRLALEALAGRNVRNALQMFSDILVSGHLSEDKVFISRVTGGAMHLPERLVIRILMRTKYRYFQDEHGYISNVFRVVNGSSTNSPFSPVLILGSLAASRKVRGELGIEGYRSVSELCAELGSQGLGASEALEVLCHLLRRGLVQADHQRSDSVSISDHVKISASGFFHLRFFTRRFEYVAAIASDCHYKNEKRAQEVYELTRNRPGFASRKPKERVQRAKLLLSELAEEQVIWREASVAPGAAYIADAVESITSAIHHFENGAPAQGAIDFHWRGDRIDPSKP